MARRAGMRWKCIFDVFAFAAVCVVVLAIVIEL